MHLLFRVWRGEFKEEACFDFEEVRSLERLVKFSSAAATWMERLRGVLIDDHHLLVGEELSSECLEAGEDAANFSEHLVMRYGNLLSHQTPFLQLLQGAMQAGEDTEREEAEQQKRFFPSFAQESNFQLLLRMQSQRCINQVRTAELEQLESCITHVSESETRAAAHQNPPATSTAMTGPARSVAVAVSSERKKRKRPRRASASKSPEEAESQRMTHITVERNRRRLMNSHLAVLRSLMPPTYVQRGDQTSIIGGAIEFIKELEQHLLSLQAQKRLRSSAAVHSTSKDDEPCAQELHGRFFVSPQYTNYSKSKCQWGEGKEGKQDVKGVDVEATLVQGHVNLKVAGRRHRGQLVRAIVALEELHLTVLHLHVTSVEPSSILYSLNLKMEEECKLGSADEVATAVHQIFGYINGW